MYTLVPENQTNVLLKAYLELISDDLTVQVMSRIL